jgi:hypothetical protein
MGSFSGTIPEKTWVLTGSSYALKVDVQAAPPSPIKCTGCDGRSVEGEPLLTMYANTSGQTWRKSYCGLCAKKWYEKFSADMAEAMAVMNSMVELIGDGFYVAKGISGKDRKSVKGLTKVLIKMCVCEIEKAKHAMMCLPCGTPHLLCTGCLHKAFVVAGKPSMVDGKYGQTACPLHGLVPRVEAKE